jgi:transcriptional regulator with XRE-family HTH domain
MAGGELSTALAVLRVIRGWNQAELAKVAAVHSSAVSAYERGKKVPGWKTVERLVSAMGFPLAALDQTRGFIEAVRMHGALAETMRPAPDEIEPASEDDPSVFREELVDNPAALRWELEQVSADAGRAFGRMVEVMVALVRSARPGGES